MILSLLDIYTLFSLSCSLLIILKNIRINYNKYDKIYNNKFGMKSLFFEFTIHLISFYIVQILYLIQWIFNFKVNYYALPFFIIGTYYGFLLFPIMIQTPIMFVTSFTVMSTFILTIYKIYKDTIKTQWLLLIITGTSVERVLHQLLINNEYNYNTAKDISHILYIILLLSISINDRNILIIDIIITFSLFYLNGKFKLNKKIINYYKK